MAPHSSTLAWKIPWMEEPGRLQFMGSLRVSHDWATSLSLFHSHALEKEMATHSSVLAWRIPGTGEPGGLMSMGLHRVRHDWSDLAAAGINYISWFWPQEHSKKISQRATMSFRWQETKPYNKLTFSLCIYPGWVLLPPHAFTSPQNPKMYLSSLLIWSPNPTVSTMVNFSRTLLSWSS